MVGALEYIIIHCQCKQIMGVHVCLDCRDFVSDTRIMSVCIIKPFVDSVP